MRIMKLVNAAFILIAFSGIYCFLKMNLPISFSPFPVEVDYSQPENFTHDSHTHILASHFRIPSKLRGKRLPFHHIYEPRQVGFPPDLQNKSRTSDKTKTILLWTPWNGILETINYYSLRPGNGTFIKYNCPNNKCVATRDRGNLKKADVVLFHLLDTKSSDLPQQRTAEQIWILYNMEPPWLIKRDVYPELSRLNNVFNWTMSYRSDSDILARYGFIMPMDKITNSVTFYNKTKNIVWFVSDCKTGSKREDYVKELTKYIDVDIYGKCGNHKCYPAQSELCYHEVLKQYKFYLSFENAICKDYVTEKFFNIFNYDIVPIVFGAADYLSIAPEGSYIDATQFSEPRDLANTLLTISNDTNLYQSFLLKKNSFKSYLDPWMCRLCEKLHAHTSEKTSVLSNMEEFWLTDADCYTWIKSNHNFEAVK